MRNLDGTELKRLHRQWRKQIDLDTALLLDSVQTPFNVGSILRTSAAYGVSHIWLTGNATPPDHPKAAKTALGTSRYLDWTTSASIDDALGSIYESEFDLVGVELADEATPIHKATFPNKPCLAFGHEDRGLSKDILAACKTVVFIPQRGRIASLNVAMAVGIALYEVHRQQWQS